MGAIWAVGIMYGLAFWIALLEAEHEKHTNRGR